MKPLTPSMTAALLAAEDTLYGDVKLVEGYGRQIRGLRNRGLVEGEPPHIYLTAIGKQMKDEIHA